MQDELKGIRDKGAPQLAPVGAEMKAGAAEEEVLEEEVKTEGMFDESEIAEGFSETTEEGNLPPG